MTDDWKQYVAITAGLLVVALAGYGTAALHKCRRRRKGKDHDND